MSSLQYIESQPDWIATYRVVRTGKLECLMATQDTRSAYWWTPDYDGIFAWGATREVLWRHFNKDYEHVRGSHPCCSLR